MCELRAIMINGNDKETLMEDVVRLTVDGSKIQITQIFGETITVHGKILLIDITKQEVLITKIKKDI